MKPLRAWMLRLAGIFRRDQREHELAAEMESHLQLHTDDNLRSGMSPAEARRDAMLKLGGVELTKQACRERDRFLLLEHLSQDLRFAIRQLVKNPGFAWTAILILSLGMGASVAIFAFVDAALIRPLPYKDPTRLLHVTESIPVMPRANLSYPDYLDWKRDNHVLSSLDVYVGRGYTLNNPDGAESVSGMRVSDGFFRTLGIAPVLGRDFYSGEDLPAAPKTVILTYGTWQKRYGGRPDVIGQTVSLSDIPHTIIGVLPQDFQFAPGGDSEYWTTLHPAGDCDLRRSCHSLEGVARLKSGETLQTALAEMTLIANQLEKQYPDSNRGQGASVIPLSEAISGNIRPLLIVVMSGAGLLLLIACINVSNLLLVRAENRRREMTIRGALGASPARLIRQFVTEGLLLVSLGSVMGIAAAYLMMHMLLGLISKTDLIYMPYLNGLGLNPHVLAFAAVVALFAAVLFSLAPVVRLPVREMRDGLAEVSRGSSAKWRQFGGKLVVLELATAMVLLVGAGLLGKSLYRLLQVELGFEPDHLAAVMIQAPHVTYPEDAQQVALARQVVARLERLPGVQSVGTTSRLPVTSNGNTEWIRLVGYPYSGEHNEVNGREVSSGFFSTIHAKLLRGRYFTDEEDASKPGVVIINQMLAKKYFPGEDPIGKQIGDTELSPKSIRQIVGVVDDVKEGALDSDIWPAVYYPFNQSPSTFFIVVVRTSLSEQALLPTMSIAIHEVAPGLVTVGGSSIYDRIRASQSANLRRKSASLVGGFAALALLLGVVGLYGVLAYSVSQRTREIGVRIALGAQRISIYRLILKEAGWLTVLGIAAGLVCSIVATNLLRGLLFGVSSWDLFTLIAVAVVLGISALLASYIPARRAASVDPMEALRAE